MWIVIMFGMVGMVGAANCGGVTQCSCGDTLTSSLVMTQDILLCSNNSITVYADDLSLDCNGHQIQGNGTDHWGVRVQTGHNFTMENCNVHSYQKGVLVQDSNYTTFQFNNVSNITNWTFFITDVGYSNFSNNRINISKNGGEGAYHFIDSWNNRVANNVVTNVNRGIYVFRGRNFLIEDNTVSNATENIVGGINVDETNDTRIYRNTVTGYNRSGVLASESFGVYVENNTISCDTDTHNCRRGLEFQAFNSHFKGNTVTGPKIGLIVERTYETDAHGHWYAGQGGTYNVTIEDNNLSGVLTSLVINVVRNVTIASNTFPSDSLYDVNSTNSSWINSTNDQFSINKVNMDATSDLTKWINVYFTSDLLGIDRTAFLSNGTDGYQKSMAITDGGSAQVLVVHFQDAQNNPATYTYNAYFVYENKNYTVSGASWDGNVIPDFYYWRTGLQVGCHLVAQNSGTGMSAAFLLLGGLMGAVVVMVFKRPESFTSEFVFAFLGLISALLIFGSIAVIIAKVACL